jgi:hypothetical protein
MCVQCKETRDLIAKTYAYFLAVSDAADVERSRKVREYDPEFRSNSPQRVPHELPRRDQGS